MTIHIIYALCLTLLGQENNGGEFGKAYIMHRDLRNAFAMKNRKDDSLGRNDLLAEK